VELFRLTVVAGVDRVWVLLFIVVVGADRVTCVFLFTTASVAPLETELLSLMMVAGVLLSLLYKSTLFTVLVRVSIPLLRIVLVVLVSVTSDEFLIALLESIDLFTILPDSLATLFLSLVTTEPLFTAGL